MYGIFIKMYVFISKTFVNYHFCIITLIIYPLAIFKNKIAKIGGVIISGIIIIIVAILCIINPPIYRTTLFSNGEKYQFDDSYKVYLKDKSYGDLSIRYEDGIEDWMVYAEFKKAGKTEMILESPTGEKKEFDISIRRDKYTINEKNK